MPRNSSAISLQRSAFRQGEAKFSSRKDAKCVDRVEGVAGLRDVGDLQHVRSTAALDREGRDAA